MSWYVPGRTRGTKKENLFPRRQSNRPTRMNGRPGGRATRRGAETRTGAK